jgi:long-chain acyl-CoA synthetase
MQWNVRSIRLSPTARRHGATVQLLPGSTTDADTVMRHASPQVTAYKRPAEIVILDQIPASSTGKILKHKLSKAVRDAANA